MKRKNQQDLQASKKTSLKKSVDTRMKFNKKFQVEPGFQSLFSFKNKKEKLEHDAKMIMFRFISEIEKLNQEKPMKKKDLAKALGTSASYITQLYRGDKLINLTTLAKLQDVYNLTFEIKAKINSANSQ